MRYLIAAITACSIASSTASAQSAPTKQFDKWDTNGDGQLVRDELPEPFRRNFDEVDADQDGFITPDEDRTFRQRRKRPQQTAVPEGYTVRRDVAYVDGGHERHVLDLYLPDRSDAKPALVVYIHGGGWRQGSKDKTPLAPILEAGFAAASINYRLSQHATFPAQIYDCKAAIRFLRSKADEYGYNADKIGVWGGSAGGHLVALLGTSAGVEAVEGDLGVTGVSSRVQAVCDYFGPTDLLKMNAQSGPDSAIDHDAPNSPESQMLGGTLQEIPDVANAASPKTYVTSDDPPFYILHGDQDRLVPLAQSETFHERLTAAGVDSTLLVVKGAGHGPFPDPTIFPTVVDFFQRTLGDTD